MTEFFTAEEAAAFLSEVDWEDAILRELVVQSPSYVSADHRIVAPDALPSLRLLIISPDDECASVELLADEVEEISVSYGMDLQPTVTLAAGVFELRFCDYGTAVIRARRLFGRRLDPEEAVGHTRGLEAPPMFGPRGMKDA